MRGAPRIDSRSASERGARSRVANFSATLSSFYGDPPPAGRSRHQ